MGGCEIVSSGWGPRDFGKRVGRSLRGATENEQVDVFNRPKCRGEFDGTFAGEARCGKKHTGGGGGGAGDGFGKAPGDFPSAVAEMAADRGMGRDEACGCGEGRGFGGGQGGIGAEIGERGALGMGGLGVIEHLLEFGDRPAFHEDVEGASIACAFEPKKGKQSLGDDEMAAFRGELSGVMAGDGTLAIEQRFLPNRALSGEAAMADRRNEGGEGGKVAMDAGRRMPEIIGLFPTLAIERSEPVVASARVFFAPSVELRPDCIEQKRRMAEGGCMGGDR